MTIQKNLTILEWIKAQIHGRLAISDIDANLLLKYVSLPGDHVEIGCLWGGTAILAALAKKEAGVDGHVYTIDFMQGGFWDNGDPCMNRQVPSYEIIIDNLCLFRVDDRVAVVKSQSNPLPLKKSIKPVTVLIDGGHLYDSVLADWLNVEKLKPDYVLFHDYNSKYHPDVQKVVDETVRANKEWREVESAGHMVAFERIKK